jgi:CRISPR-associated protein Csx10
MIIGTLQIKMLSDWHIGSGTGRPGNIDRLVQRDTCNLPYIPAKSLTGIWRDGCELVVQGLDADQSDMHWQQWVNWLFGEQQPAENENRVIATIPLAANLSVRSAHFPEALQNAFRGNVMLQNMTTFVKPGVKINSHTGSALADCLRFEEMTRRGAVLEADFSIQLESLTPEQQQIAKAILVAGALMVERLGAKRRRGAGLCKINVKGLLKDKEAIAAIEKTKGRPPTLPLPPQLKLDETLTYHDQPDAGWWRIVVAVSTLTPVIIHKQTVGNHQETLDNIPGTYFVPTVLKYLGEHLNISLSNALMHGDVVITNANPIINRERGEAVPFALFEAKAKTADEKIYQRIGEVVKAGISNEHQLKGIRRGYICLEDKNLHQLTVASEIYAHNTIVDSKQRPDAEIGGIYTYAAIPSGSKFEFEIRIRDYLVPSKAVNPLDTFLKTEIFIQIGRTKKDDYGKVKLKQIQSGKIAIFAQKQTEILSIWLLSNLLLRDERLRPTVDPQIFGKRLEEELKVGLSLLKESQSGLPQIDSLVAFARSSRTESWQTKWGLPRPSLVGLSAGTVLQFTVTGSIDPQSLQRLEVSGFGERTAEGYGQVRFNSLLLKQTDMVMPQDKEVGNNSASHQQTLITAKDLGYEYAKLVETETWRDMIRRSAAAIAAAPEILKLSLNQSKLTSSKLSTLRTLVDSLSSSHDVTRILAVITRMETKESWKGKTLTEVKQLISEPNKVWDYYQEVGCNFSQYRLTTLNEQVLKQEIWVEAVRILVDACVRAHKRKTEQP